MITEDFNVSKKMYLTDVILPWTQTIGQMLLLVSKQLFFYSRQNILSFFPEGQRICTIIFHVLRHPFFSSRSHVLSQHEQQRQLCRHQPEIYFQLEYFVVMHIIIYCFCSIKKALNTQKFSLPSNFCCFHPQMNW